MDLSKKLIGESVIRGTTFRFYKGDPAVKKETATNLRKALPGLNIKHVETDHDTFFRNTLPEGPYLVTYDIVSADDTRMASIFEFRLINLRDAINNFAGRAGLGKSWGVFFPKSDGSTNLGPERIAEIGHERNVDHSLTARLTLYPYAAQYIAEDPKMAKAMREDPEVKAALKPVQEALLEAGIVSHSAKITRQVRGRRDDTPPSSHGH